MTFLSSLWGRFRRWWYLITVGMWRGERALTIYWTPGLVPHLIAVELKDRTLKIFWKRKHP